MATSLKPLLCCMVLGAIICPTTSHAFDFSPTEAEWQAWPDYCRAKYIGTNIGHDSEFASRVNAGDVTRWQAEIGDQAWYALHHYCAGIAHVDRSSRAVDNDKRRSELGDAIDELTFYLTRTPHEHPLYVEAVARVCLVRDQLGKTDEAIKDCDTAIAAQPSNAVGYTAKATVYRRHQKFADARKVLEVGNDKTEGKSAELLYFLGLTCVDQKDYTKAVEYARRAYGLGYPLPGLRNRLRASGYPL